MENTLHLHELYLILWGIAAGTAARLYTLRVDARQNPSYPNGYFSNLVTGFIAACLGAVAIPTLLDRNFTAVTFLALAIQHFREVRKLEQESLTRLEETEYYTRGEAYIDGIAKTYEARNYISLLTALFTVLAGTLLFTGSPLADGAIALGAGVLAIWLLCRFTKGKQVGDIAQVTPGNIEIRGSELYVDGVYVTSTLGSEYSREFFLREGLAFVIQPNEQRDSLTLENFGQRQAMLFEAIKAYGVRRYKYHRRSFSDNRIVLAFVPILRDEAGAVAAIKNTPVLESSRKVHRKRKGEKPQ